MAAIVNLERAALHNTWIELDKSRLLANVRELRQTQSAKTQLMAIVKANAYGHGLAPISQSLGSQADYLGVTSIREALEIKKLRCDAHVFILSSLFAHEIPHAILDHVTLSVSSFEEAFLISEESKKQNKITTVHIKIDTGMGRLGIPLGNAISQIEKIEKLPHLDLEGIYTHFPTAEKVGGLMGRQIQDFTLLLQALEKKNLVFRLRHAANSAGSIKLSSPIFNMIRPGIMLYGVLPDKELAGQINVQPVLSLKSRILLIKRLQPGQSVGYGCEFIAQDPSTIAIVPIGYSHGYPFRASKTAEVLVHGKRFHLAGRISMDYMAVNLKNAYAQIGEEVTLIGKQGAEQITAQDIAEWADTIPYEVLTRLSPNIPRIEI